MVLWKKEASLKIGNQVWYCQSTKAKATLWSVDLTEGSNCWIMLWKWQKGFLSTESGSRLWLMTCSFDSWKVREPLMPFLWQDRCRRIFWVKGKKLYFGFVDLEKAFDRVPREVISWAMRKLGDEEWLVSAVMSMYSGAKTVVRTVYGNGRSFEVKVDMHQGSSPLLFVIVMEAISRKFRVALPWELLYAYDLAVIAETEDELIKRLNEGKTKWRVKAWESIWIKPSLAPTAERPLKFRIFENSRWRQPPSGKSQKSLYLRKVLTDLYEIKYADAKWVSYPPWPLKKIEFHKSKMADGRRFTNRYIIVSQKPFDWFLLNLARWCMLMHVGFQSLA